MEAFINSIQIVVNPKVYKLGLVKCQAFSENFDYGFSSMCNVILIIYYPSRPRKISHLLTLNY